MKVKITERGWGGHFICADKCLFRRNTLLECGDTKIIVSTVGNMMVTQGSRCEQVTIGPDRFYETMAFRAKQDGYYLDADVSEPIEIESKTEIDYIGNGSDNAANEMHDAACRELIEKIAKGGIS